MAMNPLVKNGVAAAVLVGAGWWGMNAHNAQIDDHEYQTEIEKVKREFTERSRWVASVAKQPEYTDELQRLLKWYFAEITDVNNRFPGRADEMKAMKEAEQMVKKSRIKADELPKYQEWFDYTKSVYDRMKAGGFEPVLTGYDGTMRMDIYRLERDDPSTGSGRGKPQLRMDFVLWGVPRKTVAEEVGGKRVKRTSTALAFDSMGFKFMDEKGHIKFEMSGGGNPFLKVDNPERWLALFPPQAILGTYYLDVFPPALNMEMTMVLQGAAPTGTAIPASFKWEMPVKDGWKPKPGEKWEGEEREESEEYIGNKK